MSFVHKSNPRINLIKENRLKLRTALNKTEADLQEEARRDALFDIQPITPVPEKFGAILENEGLKRKRVLEILKSVLESVANAGVALQHLIKESQIDNFLRFHRQFIKSVEGVEFNNISQFTLAWDLFMKKIERTRFTGVEIPLNIADLEKLKEKTPSQLVPFKQQPAPAPSSVIPFKQQPAPSRVFPRPVFFGDEKAFIEDEKASIEEIEPKENDLFVKNKKKMPVFQQTAIINFLENFNNQALKIRTALLKEDMTPMKFLGLQASMERLANSVHKARTEDLRVLSATTKIPVFSFTKGEVLPMTLGSFLKQTKAFQKKIYKEIAKKLGIKQPTKISAFGIVDDLFRGEMLAGNDNPLLKDKSFKKNFMKKFHCKV